MRAHRQRTFSRIAIAAVFFFAGALATAQTPDTFNDELNRGVAAFKAEHYEQAIEAFQQATTLNPTSTTAIIDLGCAYAYQAIPDNPNMLETADKAIALFKQIPPDDSQYFVALKQIATLYRKTNRFDQARDMERAALKLKPNDADTRYTIGVIDWAQAYTFAVEALAFAGLKNNGIGNKQMSSATCIKVKAHNAPLVADAIAELSRVVELEPKNADAMEYLNLAYRRKADVDCTKPSARIQDISIASRWSTRAAKAKFPSKTLWQKSVPEPPSPIVQ